ncbi:V-set and immunoglobulin domain-containing protein 10-like [Branchiostoma floridae]|uniref:V-set and immunoglobulin domain-containing protein 10-like n=1 Tax=Branchiostoma floridae TaxID=7739 RepID=A0A9J7KQL6_BRAFL|nr:V-set and immunoglobulin domain-containing protein 10-like [Branchiostoma floridae]
MIEPAIMITTEDVAAQIFEEAGKSVTLPCDYSFSGARYTIDWHRGAERLLNFFSEDSNPTFDSTDLSGRLSLQDGKNLVISNLQGTDDGRYYCGVSEIGGNPPGDGSDKNLVVTVSPSVTLLSSVQSTAATGSDVTLTCSVDSKPAANITWVGPNGDLGTGTSVVLNNVQPANDTGTYTCTATNSFSASKSASGSVVLIFQVMVTTATTPAREVDCFGSGTVAGAAVGCLAAGVLLGSAAVFILLRLRTADSKKNPTGDGISDDRQYENVRQGRVTSSLMETGNDEYEVPMETFHPPPQSSGDYQELRPAVYQSLQKN